MKATLEQESPIASLVEQERPLCVNCGHAVAGNYCADCGQRKGVSRIGWKNLVQEFTSRWLGFDNQFWRTFLHMTYRPGRLLHTYLCGNRVTYLGPLSYYFIVSALVLLGFSVLDINLEEFMRNSSNFGTMDEPEGKALKLQQEMLHYMSSLLRFMVILFVPFFALAAMLLYRNKKLNFLEYCIIMIYSSAHTFWLTLFQGVLYKTTGSIYSVISIIISIIYTGFMFMDCFQEKKTLFGFLKGGLTYLLGFLLTMIMIVLVMVVAALLI